MTVKILLLGSYNGHDSLGDECLLESVITQFLRVLEEPEFILHAHDPHTEFSKYLQDRYEFKCNEGIQSLFWWWRNKWRHLHVPLPLYSTIAALLFPFYLLASLLIPGSRGGLAIRQICRADVVYVFGGTNFSRQWFWLNAPYYFATSLLAAICGARTWYATQQYGPMTPWQTRWMKWNLKWLVADFRVRNPDCLAILGESDNRRETWDEVYSNRLLYPVNVPVVSQDRYILLNLRCGDLISRFTYSEDDLERFIVLLQKVQQGIGLPFRFFAVSGETFCEDEEMVRILRGSLGDVFDKSVGRVPNGAELVRLGEDAALCISMSFHGCILSGMAGIPFIPVTDGAYYDHKYRGFDKYGDGQFIPLVELLNCDPDADASAIMSFYRHFDARAAASRREQAAELMEAWYESIAAAVCHREI